MLFKGGGVIIWYKHIYEFLFQTEPLFNNILLDWILPGFIVFLLYDFAFGIVGGLYRAGVIKGKDLGSIIHWGIRYGIMWLIIQGLIIIRDHWLLIIVSVLTIVILAVLIGIIVSKYNDD